VRFDRRSLGPDGHVLVHAELERAGFLVAFTERTGGASDQPYDTLNLSQTVGDRDDVVRRNRALVTGALGVDAFALTEQVHGAGLVSVGIAKRTSGFERSDGRFPGADAMSTTTSNVALAVLTADCVPVVAASPSQGMLVVAHAGWRGIANGIVSNVAREFDDHGDVQVALGPAIGVDHYQVGNDVASSIAGGTRSGVVTERRDGGVHVDLVATIRQELAACGIAEVEDTGLCTACHPDRFFSYRRDGTTGRQAAIAVKL
jgi:polyphenol oxidase